MSNFSNDGNPLLSTSPDVWDDLIESVGPASLLVVIESRMSPTLRRQTTAEDILQESLMHAWRDRSKCEWRGLKSFRSWLLTIIDHRIGHLAAAAATQKRGAAVRVTSFSAVDVSRSASSSGGESSFPVPAGSTTPSRIAVFREQADAMRQALANLPDEFSDVIRLRIFEQLTLNEISQRLGVGLSVVRRRFGQGLELYERQFRQALLSRSQPSKSTTDGHPSP